MEADYATEETSLLQPSQDGNGRGHRRRASGPKHDHLTDEDAPSLLASLCTFSSPQARALLAHTSFALSIVWLTMGGFGPTWALFSIVQTTTLVYSPAHIDLQAEYLAYFLTATLVAFVGAVGRTAVILTITLDREREQVKRQLAALPAKVSPQTQQQAITTTTATTDQPIQSTSHTAYWWASRSGLALSSLWVLGDGMGRVWVCAAVVDTFVALYSPTQTGLFWNHAYLNVALTVAAISGVARFSWWIW